MEVGEAYYRLSTCVSLTKRDLAFAITTIVLLAIGIAGLCNWNFLGAGKLNFTASLIFVGAGLVSAGLGFLFHYCCREQNAVEQKPVIQPDAVEQKPEDPLHLRTRAMDEHLQRLGGYDINAGIWTKDGIQYQVVNSEIVNFANAPLPLLSVGCSESREMVHLDANSPWLQGYYKNFVKHVQKGLHFEDKLTPEEFLSRVYTFMKIVFPNHKIENIVAKAMQLNRIVSIDAFLQAGSGVCRHHALVGAYFIDRFLEENPNRCSFKAKVQVMRDQVKGGAHSWLTLVCENRESYSLDSLNDIYGNLSDKKFTDKFEKMFGRDSLVHQSQKAKIVWDKYFKPAREQK